MDSIRAEESQVYSFQKGELYQGIEGVTVAVKVLRDYYAAPDKDHAQAEGAEQGIVGLLEKVESKLREKLAGRSADEESTQSSYMQDTNDNDMVQAT